jgi:hypothetical protein
MSKLANADTCVRVMALTSDAFTAGSATRNAPKAVLATLSAFEVRYDCPVVFAPTAIEAALQAERWFYYFAREMNELVNKMARAS